MMCATLRPWRLCGAEAVHLPLIVVHQGDVVAKFSKTDSRNQSYIACSYYQNVHLRALSSWAYRKPCHEGLRR